MKYTLSLLTFLLLFSFKVKAQDNGADTLKISQFNIKTSPLTLLDPSVASAQIVLEYRHKQNWAIQGNYSFATPAVYSFVKDKSNVKLLRYKGELRRFFQDEVYLGLEYEFSRYSFDVKDEYYGDINDRKSVYNFESATFNKSYHVGNVKFGVQWNSRKVSRLLFDVYFGVGLKRLNIDFTNVENPIPVSILLGDTYVMKQSNGTYLPLDEAGQLNPPSDAVEHSVATEVVRLSDGSYKLVDRSIPRWDMTELLTNRGNFTFGFKIGYTLWSKNKTQF